MLDFPGVNLLTLIELISTMAVVGTLIYGIRVFRRDARVKEAIFVKDLFEGFQRDRQFILDNPMARKIEADKRELTEEKFTELSIGSFDISRAFLNYDAYAGKHISDERWEYIKQDMRDLFDNDSIRERWQTNKSIYKIDFQHFIDEEIISQIA